MPIDFHKIADCANRAIKLQAFLKDFQSSTSFHIRMNSGGDCIEFGSAPGHAGGPGHDVRAFLVDHLKSRLNKELSEIISETQVID